MKRLAIIGIGPRGLRALECLLLRLDGKLGRCIYLYEETDNAGYGPVYDTEQPDSNWLNIDENSLDNLPGRPRMEINGTLIPAYPSYSNSPFRASSLHAEDANPYIFPARSQMGKYLKERYKTLMSGLVDTGLVISVNSKVIDIQSLRDRLNVIDANGDSREFDEVLLTIGHQPVEKDEQLEMWEKNLPLHEIELISDPYPIAAVSRAMENESHQVIAVRGFGLAAIDVIRSLFQSSGGFFISENHNMDILSCEKGQRSIKIVPFSLDGLPPVPKPYSKLVDDVFKPTHDQIRSLEKNLKENINAQVRSHEFFINAMSLLIAGMFCSYSEDKTVSQKSINNSVKNWIRDGSIDPEHILNEGLDVIEIMKSFKKMAYGEREASLDYFAGQVWRHCQPTLYSTLSHSQLPDTVMGEIIKIDERIKRYSYGPPVASIQQLIFLAESGVLDLSKLNDPDINFDEYGWNITNGSGKAIATLMVNSIIDSPELLKVNSPLVKRLLDKNTLMAVHKDFGIETTPEGQIIVPNDANPMPIYLLGRLAKGSVIGVDAILECFGERIDVWADGCVERINNEHV